MSQDSALLLTVLYGGCRTMYKRSGILQCCVMVNTARKKHVRRQLSSLTDAGEILFNTIEVKRNDYRR